MSNYFDLLFAFLNTEIQIFMVYCHSLEGNAAADIALYARYIYIYSQHRAAIQSPSLSLHSPSSHFKCILCKYFNACGTFEKLNSKMYK